MCDGDSLRFLRAMFAREPTTGSSTLDVTLQGDAYRLARALRQRAGQTELRLIALTNSIEHSTREQARSAGFERCRWTHGVD